MKNFASFVSFILGIPWVVIIVWVLLFETGLSTQQTQLFGFLFPLLHIVIPLVYVIWAVKRGHISDLDITKREERYGILTVVFMKNVISLVVIALFGNTLLLQLALTVFTVFTVAYVVTFFWKISLHMTFNTVGITLVNAVNDWQFLYLYALIPVIFWSRLNLKKHTVSQLIAGFVVSEVIMLGGFWLFGII